MKSSSKLLIQTNKIFVKDTLNLLSTKPVVFGWVVSVLNPIDFCIPESNKQHKWLLDPTYY